MKNNLFLLLAGSRAGRCALHLLALLLSGHAVAHFAGIVREFRGI